MYNKEYRRKYYIENKERELKKCREYYQANKDKCLAATKKWFDAHPEKKEEYKNKSRGKYYYSEYHTDYYSRNPEKYKAHNAFTVAKRAGKITIRPCEVCGNTKSQGHHPDYSKPLDVIWLCPKHHSEKHSHENSSNTHVASRCAEN